jgi:hypothetical protein
MLASPAALAAGGAGAELAATLGKQGYRSFTDPALLTDKVRHTISSTESQLD